MQAICFRKEQQKKNRLFSPFSPLGPGVLHAADGLQLQRGGGGGAP